MLPLTLESVMDCIITHTLYTNDTRCTCIYVHVPVHQSAACMESSRREHSQTSDPHLLSYGRGGEGMV